MATLYIKYTKKCEKDMVPFGQGVATPILSSISSKIFQYYGRILVEGDFIVGF